MTRVIKIGKKVFGRKPDVNEANPAKGSVKRSKAKSEPIGIQHYGGINDVPSTSPNDITNWYEILNNGDVRVTTSSTTPNYYITSDSISNTYRSLLEDPEFMNQIRQALDERR